MNLLFIYVFVHIPGACVSLRVNVMSLISDNLHCHRSGTGAQGWFAGFCTSSSTAACSLSLVEEAPASAVSLPSLPHVPPAAGAAWITQSPADYD